MMHRPLRIPFDGELGKAMQLTLPKKKIPITHHSRARCKRIRVGFVVHVMQVAGAEMLVAETIRQLATDIEPTILCLDAVGEMGKRLQQEGVPIICLDRRPGRDWGLARRFAKIVREHEIEIVHAHQYTPFFYSGLAKLLFRARFQLILTEHGRHFPDVVSWKRRVLNRLILSHCANAVSAVCDFSARALREVDGFGGKTIEVIENGVDYQAYQPIQSKESLRRKLELDPARKYLICVARFHPVKDHATLLRGFARIAPQCPNANLLLAGDGPLRSDLESLTHQLHLQDRVQFLGVRADIPELLQAADLFVMTSLSEAASLTLLEAMAVGLPVVVTDVGGNPEIVRHNIDGLLVPRQDDAALSEALSTLLHYPEKAEALGASGRDRVHQKYDLQRTIARYHQLYQQLAAI
jgi:N-acetyl-alpha-D-glucosaminyl L-malate synthase BshA